MGLAVSMVSSPLCHLCWSSAGRFSKCRDPKTDERLVHTQLRLIFNMASVLRERFQAVKDNVSEKRRPAGWALPKEIGSFAEEGTW